MQLVLPNVKYGSMVCRMKGIFGTRANGLAEKRTKIMRDRIARKPVGNI